MIPSQVAAELVAPHRWSARHQREFRFRVNGIRFLAPGEYLGNVEHIFVDREYAAVAGILADSRSPTVIDAGAHIGMFSIYALAQAPSAILHSLEPGADAYQVLERNCRMNHSLNWQSHHAALWSHSGRVGFQVDEQVPTRSAVVERNATTVPCLSLEDLLRDSGMTYVDLLKMDIEGAEEAVLTAARHLLPRVAHLLIQVHPNRVDAARVQTLLREAFDHVYRIPGERQNPLLLASRTEHDLPLEGT